MKIIIFGIMVLGLIVLAIIKKERIKLGIQKRTEKNAVKVPSISYKDRTGNVITEDIVIKRSNLPLIGDWARVYPVLNEDGSWNIINAIFGGKKNLIKLLIVLGLVAVVLLAFSEFFSQYDALKSACPVIYP